MKLINYYLTAFGFLNYKDYLGSTFGYMMSPRALSVSIVIGYVSSLLKQHLGFSLVVFLAFVVLNFLEFKTGVKASKRKGQKVESRKMGRMFLKVGTYVIIIWILNAFQTELKFPSIMNFQLNPFIVVYWAFLAGVIYQLFISLLENLVALGFHEADGVLGFVIRKYNKYFEKDAKTSN